MITESFIYQNGFAVKLQLNFFKIIFRLTSWSLETSNIKNARKQNKELDFAKWFSHSNKGIFPSKHRQTQHFIHS